MKVYVVELKSGKIYDYKIEEFISYFNQNEYMAHDYNAFLHRENAEAESSKIQSENIKLEGI